MAEKECFVYTVPEVCGLLGIGKVEAYHMIEQGEFPFPLLRIGERKWLVPKAPVDRFLKGVANQSQRMPWVAGKRGRPRKFQRGEYINYNYQVSVETDKRFTAVCNAINQTLASPLSKGDYVRLALNEFIDRRPEFLKEAESDEEAAT